MGMQNRLRETILLKNKTLREFSQKTNIPYTTLQRYLAGSRKPGMEALINIKNHLDISIDWLLTGEPKKTRDQPAEYGGKTGG